MQPSLLAAPSPEGCLGLSSLHAASKTAVSDANNLERTGFSFDFGCGFFLLIVVIRENDCKGLLVEIQQVTACVPPSGRGGCLTSATVPSILSSKYLALDIDDEQHSFPDVTRCRGGSRSFWLLRLLEE
jgi:hypothetical protein